MEEDTLQSIFFCIVSLKHQDFEDQQELGQIWDRLSQLLIFGSSPVCQ